MLGAPDSAFGAQMLQQLLLQYAARLYIKARPFLRVCFTLPRQGKL